MHIPSLGGATEWLNSEPLGPAELRGHVVLVNFWTLTCINWLRTARYVRAWSPAYRMQGRRPRHRDDLLDGCRCTQVQPATRLLEQILPLLGALGVSPWRGSRVAAAWG